MTIGAGRIILIAGPALAVTVVIVAEHDAAAPRQIDIALLNVVRGLADVRVASDGYHPGHAALDVVGNVQDRRNGQPGITFKSELLDVIALTLDRALVLDPEIPLGRHEVVNAKHAKNFPAK